MKMPKDELELSKTLLDNEDLPKDESLPKKDQTETRMIKDLLYTILDLQR